MQSHALRVHNLPKDVNYFKSSNKKVRNASKVVGEDGIRYDSKLELYAATLFRSLGIPYEYQRKYELQPKFRYNSELIRPITLTVDFWIPKLNVIVDTKGFQTEQNKIKWKLLKGILHADRLILERASDPSEAVPQLPEIFLPSSKKATEALALRLKERL